MVRHRPGERYPRCVRVRLTAAPHRGNPAGTTTVLSCIMDATPAVDGTRPASTIVATRALGHRHVRHLSVLQHASRYERRGPRVPRGATPGVRSRGRLWVVCTRCGCWNLT